MVILGGPIFIKRWNNLINIYLIIICQIIKIKLMKNNKFTSF